MLHPAGAPPLSDAAVSDDAGRPVAAGRAPTFYSLQALRAVAALMVMIYHAELMFARDRYFGVSVAPFFRAGDAGVQLFYVLSGFVIYLAHRLEFGRADRLGVYARKRFVRVYLPLWLVVTLMLPLALGGLMEQRPSTWEAINAYLSLPAQREVILTVQHTLRHEVLFYLAFAAMFLKPRVGVVLLGGWFALSTLPLFVTMAFPWSFVFDVNHLLFGSGIAIAAIGLRRNFALYGPTLLAGGILFVSAWMSTLPNEAPERILMLGLGGAGIIYGLCGLERNRPMRLPAALLLLGNASYVIYLTHNTLLVIGARVALALHARIALPVPVWFCLVLAMALAGGVVFHLLVERPMLKAVNGWLHRRDARQVESGA